MKERANENTVQRRRRCIVFFVLYQLQKTKTMTGLGLRQERETRAVRSLAAASKKVKTLIYHPLRTPAFISTSVSRETTHYPTAGQEHRDDSIWLIAMHISSLTQDIGVLEAGHFEAPVRPAWRLISTRACC